MADALLMGLELQGRLVVAVGGGAVTARRVLSFLDAGADVRVVAPVLDAELSLLADAGQLRWAPRHYRQGDLADAWLAHTATGDASVDAAVSAEAQASRIWCVNAGDAGLTSARTPARAQIDTVLGPAQVGVLTGAPRRSVRVRNLLVSVLNTGVPGRRIRSSA